MPETRTDLSDDLDRIDLVDHPDGIRAGVREASAAAHRLVQSWLHGPDDDQLPTPDAA
ncbi:hypothetical protein [Nocardiopsis sp. NRRL B-16309]|uniref:hypothetical protein n=1 Tax=Nocardiopsis sp. NRRL B-16309 TaxID=1519494 RepID=UPI000B11AD96|nr:hypothetical protein [Nocardiopsis sp. NRRL B-16309]